MEDVLDLYERPLSSTAPVVCLDEKPVQLLADTRPPRISSKGTRLRDYEYARRGVANIFVAVEPKAGHHFAKVTERRDREAFAWALRDIAAEYPLSARIHLVLDNLNIHDEKSVHSVFGPVDGRRLWRRFVLHYTPKHGSWLNQAEIEIGVLSTECLRNSRWGDRASLARHVRAWRTRANRRRRTISWRFTSKDARAKLNYRRASTNLTRPRH